MKKLKLYGPVQDGMFDCWQVLGPRGGCVGEFLTKKAAQEYIKQQKEKEQYVEDRISY